MAQVDLLEIMFKMIWNNIITAALLEYWYFTKYDVFTGLEMIGITILFLFCT